MSADLILDNDTVSDAIARLSAAIPDFSHTFESSHCGATIDFGSVLVAEACARLITATDTATATLTESARASVQHLRLVAQEFSLLDRNSALLLDGNARDRR